MGGRDTVLSDNLSDNNSGAGPARVDDVSSVDGLHAVLLQDSETLGTHILLNGFGFFDQLKIVKLHFC